jgi:hypothetical protein
MTGLLHACMHERCRGIPLLGRGCCVCGLIDLQDEAAAQHSVVLGWQVCREAASAAVVHVGCQELRVHPLQLLLRRATLALLQGCCDVLRTEVDSQLPQAGCHYCCSAHGCGKDA